jgi:hypothetical protein
VGAVVSTAPWLGPVSAQVVAVVIRACEIVASGDRAGGIQFLADSRVDPLRLRAAAIRVLGVLFLGEGMAERFDRLRAELLRVAEETGAPSGEIELALAVASAAQFWASGDMAALNAVIEDSRFTVCDQASVAVQLVGQLLEDAPEQFAELRRRFGIEGTRPPCSSRSARGVSLTIGWRSLRLCSLQRHVYRVPRVLPRGPIPRR